MTNKTAPTPAQTREISAARRHVVECRSIADRYPSAESAVLVSRAELRYCSIIANVYPRRNCHTIYQVGPQTFIK